MSTSTSQEIYQQLHALENLIRTAHEVSETALLLRNDEKQYGYIHLATQELRKARVIIQNIKRGKISALATPNPAA